MTLTAEESSNKEWIEALPTEKLIEMIRVAMGEGCIRPCHIYDAVDEVLCRLSKTEESQRNCDVFLDRDGCEKGYAMYLKWNMEDRLNKSDLTSSAMDWEDWLFAEFEPKFYKLPGDK